MTQRARWLVFGVGNPSRGDDALGPLFVERLDAWSATAGDLSVALATLTDFQWQIEHALDLADIDVVIFVDASVRAEPPFELAPLAAKFDATHSTHALSPACLLAVAERLGQTVPGGVAAGDSGPRVRAWRSAQPGQPELSRRGLRTSAIPSDRGAGRTARPYRESRRRDNVGEGTKLNRVELGRYQIIQGAGRRAAQPAALRRDGVADEPGSRRGFGRAAARSRLRAGRHALCRQADHRRGRAAGGGAGQTRGVPAMAGRRSSHPHRPSAPDRIRVDRHGRRSRAGGLARRQPVVGTRDQCVERAPDGARRDARSRGFRGRRFPGSAGAGAPPEQRADDSDESAVGPGAKHGDGGELRRRPRGLCALAHRAACSSFGAGLSGRGAFQRQKLFARLRPHAGAARTRLHQANRRQRRNRQGSEDFRAQRLSDRTLYAPRDRFLRRQPQAGGAARAVGRVVHGDRRFRLLHRLRLYRVADADRGVFGRRPHLPRRIVPAAARPARGSPVELFLHRRPGALSRRSLFVFRRSPENSVAGQSACPSRSRSARASCSRTWASFILAPNVGPCAI